MGQAGGYWDITDAAPGDCGMREGDDEMTEHDLQVGVFWAFVAICVIAIWV